MRALRLIAGTGAVIILAGAATATTISQVNQGTTNAEQERLSSFYSDPEPMPQKAGTLIRSEPLTQADGTPVQVKGANAIRFLYTSTRPSGEVAVSGGMAFIPTSPAPAAGRPILAWAHGTVGQGDACAPSRSATPTKPIATWLPLALERGWAVIATDYTGLGTTGPNLYLVGEAEATDVVHSLQAAADLEGAALSHDVVVMGHSQGGHSSLWTGEIAESVDPSIDLKGVAAIAPAAELVSIMEAQWQTPVAWLIGPEVIASWPVVDDKLNDEVLTAGGKAQATRLANECIGNALGAGLVNQLLGDRFFAQDPLLVPAWHDFAEEQTPAPLPASIPIYLGQSTADNVVLAWPNAALEKQWCASGSTISATWISNVSHLDTALVLGPDVIQWAAARFANKPAPSTCSIAPPELSAQP